MRRDYFVEIADLPGAPSINLLSKIAFAIFDGSFLTSSLAAKFHLIYAMKFFARMVESIFNIRYIRRQIIF